MLCICKLSAPLFGNLVPRVWLAQLDGRFWSRAVVSISNTHSELWKPRWSTLVAWHLLHRLQTSVSPDFPIVISTGRKMWRTMQSRSQEKREKPLNVSLNPHRPQTSCEQQAPLSTELAKLTKQPSAGILSNTKTNITWSSRKKPTKQIPSGNLQKLLLLGDTIYNWIPLLPLPVLFNPVDISLCPHSLHFQNDFSKLNELHISCSTANALNLFGGQNLTENPIKPSAFSAGTGTISRNSHMSWSPWRLKTAVSVAASFHFLSTLNLRNIWQPTSVCENYATNKFQKSVRTPFDGVAHPPRWNQDSKGRSSHTSSRGSVSLTHSSPEGWLPPGWWYLLPVTALTQVPMWLCGDRWDSVCYNWHQLPQASHHKNLTLVSTFYTWMLFIRVTPSGGWGGRKTDSDSDRARACCQARPPTPQAAEVASPTQKDRAHKAKLLSCCWDSHKKQCYF